MAPFIHKMQLKVLHRVCFTAKQEQFSRYQETKENKTNVCTHTHIYIHIYTYIYINIHTEMCIQTNTMLKEEYKR